MTVTLILSVVFVLSLLGLYMNRRKKNNIVARITKECKGKYVEDALKKDEDMMMVGFWFAVYLLVAIISAVVLVVTLIN